MYNVLIVTSSIDYTVGYIMKKYSSKVNFYRFDVDKFSEYKINVSENGWSISHCTWINKITNTSIYSIYYRKPMFPDVTKYDEEYRDMICNDILSLINGMVDSFNRVVLTKPSILRKCENKIYQLLTAQKFGLKIPISYIGNNLEDAQNKNVLKYIIKPIYTGKVVKAGIYKIFQTNLFNMENELETDISLTPIYLQQYIEKYFEVRITVILDKVFPVKIIAHDKIDWRKSYEKNKYEIVTIPCFIKDRIFEMMKSYELNFAAFDFIVSNENEWIFLEVNPNGQWYWLEKALGINISGCIVDSLIK